MHTGPALLPMATPRPPLTAMPTTLPTSPVTPVPIATMTLSLRTTVPASTPTPAPTPTPPPAPVSHHAGAPPAPMWRMPRTRSTPAANPPRAEACLLAPSAVSVTAPRRLRPAPARACYSSAGARTAANKSSQARPSTVPRRRRPWPPHRPRPRERDQRPLRRRAPWNDRDRPRAPAPCPPADPSCHRDALSQTSWLMSSPPPPHTAPCPARRNTYLKQTRRYRCAQPSSRPRVKIVRRKSASSTTTQSRSRTSPTPDGAPPCQRGLPWSPMPPLAR